MIAHLKPLEARALPDSSLWNSQGFRERSHCDRHSEEFAPRAFLVLGHVSPAERERFLSDARCTRLSFVKPYLLAAKNTNEHLSFGYIIISLLEP